MSQPCLHHRRRLTCFKHHSSGRSTYATLQINCRGSHGMFVQKSIECHSSNDGGGNFQQRMQGYKRFSFPKELGKLEGVISLPLSTPDHQHERALATTLDSRRDDGQNHRRYMLMRTPVSRQSTEVRSAHSSSLIHHLPDRSPECSPTSFAPPLLQHTALH